MPREKKLSVTYIAVCNLVVPVYVMSNMILVSRNALTS